MVNWLSNITSMPDLWGLPVHWGRCLHSTCLHHEHTANDQNGFCRFHPHYAFHQLGCTTRNILATFWLQLRRPQVQWAQDSSDMWTLLLFQVESKWINILKWYNRTFCKKCGNKCSIVWYFVSSLCQQSVKYPISFNYLILYTWNRPAPASKRG